MGTTTQNIILMNTVPIGLRMVAPVPEITPPPSSMAAGHSQPAMQPSAACGTGTGSVVLALTLLGRVSGEDVAVTVPGGELHVTIDRDCSSVQAIWLTGPTNIVCEGEVRDESLGRGYLILYRSRGRSGPAPLPGSPGE